MNNVTDFNSLVNYLIELISLMIPVLIALTAIFVIWRLIDAWVINSGDTKKVDEGKTTAIVGVVALVIMSSIWGILELLRSSLFSL